MLTKHQFSIVIFTALVSLASFGYGTVHAILVGWYVFSFGAVAFGKSYQFKRYVASYRSDSQHLPFIFDVLLYGLVILSSTNLGTINVILSIAMSGFDLGFRVIAARRTPIAKYNSI